MKRFFYTIQFFWFCMWAFCAAAQTTINISGTGQSGAIDAAETVCPYSTYTLTFGGATAPYYVISAGGGIEYFNATTSTWTTLTSPFLCDITTTGGGNTIEIRFTTVNSQTIEAQGFDGGFGSDPTTTSGVTTFTVLQPYHPTIVAH